MRLNFKTKMLFDEKIETNFRQQILDDIKFHTLRKSKRIQAGCKLEMATGSLYKPDFFKYTNCISTQEVEMSMYFHSTFKYEVRVLIDKKSLDFKEQLIFSKNDGFISYNYFVFWFFREDALKLHSELCGNLKGQTIKLEPLNLIHWTPLRY